VKKQFCIIYDGVIHPSRESVFIELKNQFPDYDVDIINLLEIYRKDYFTQIINLFCIFTEYLPNLLFDLHNPKIYFWRTAYIFKKTNTIVRKIIESRNYEFTFQLNLMIDASTKAIPHFLYTDIVYQAYFNYPVVNKFRLNSATWRKNERETYKNTKVNFVRSNYLKDYLVNHYEIEKEKVQVVYSGSNIPLNKNIDTNYNKYKSKRILFIGKDWERKGGVQLLDAFKIVLDKIPDAILTIVGCIPKVNISNVEVYGKLKPEELIPHFENSSVFCMPSLREPFGTAYIEAFQFKIPVISLDMGATKDFVIDGETGFRVKPFDIEDLAEKLIYLLSNPGKCRLMGESGFKLTLEKYNWKSAVSAIKERILYELNKK